MPPSQAASLVQAAPPDGRGPAAPSPHQAPPPPAATPDAEGQQGLQQRSCEAASLEPPYAAGMGRLPPDLLVREVFGRCSRTLRAVVLQRVCREWRGLLRGEAAGMKRSFGFAPDLPVAELEGKATHCLTGPAVAAIGSLEQLTWMHQQGHLSVEHEDQQERSKYENIRPLQHYALVITLGNLDRALWLWDHGYRLQLKDDVDAIAAIKVSGTRAMRDWLWEHGARFRSSDQDFLPSALLEAGFHGSTAFMEWLMDRGCELWPWMWPVVVGQSSKKPLKRLLALLDWLHQRGCPSWERDPTVAAALVQRLSASEQPPAIVQWFAGHGLVV